MRILRYLIKRVKIAYGFDYNTETKAVKNALYSEKKLIEYSPLNKIFTHTKKQRKKPTHISFVSFIFIFFSHFFCTAIERDVKRLCNMEIYCVINIFVVTGVLAKACLYGFHNGHLYPKQYLCSIQMTMACSNSGTPKSQVL